MRYMNVLLTYFMKLYSVLIWKLTILQTRSAVYHVCITLTHCADSFVKELLS